MACPGKCEWIFSLIYRDVDFVLWSVLFLLPLGLLAHLAKFVNMFWAANLHRRVLGGVKGWYVEKRGAESRLLRCVDWFSLWIWSNPKPGGQVCHAWEGAPRTEACTCLLYEGEWLHGGTAYKEQTTSSFCWHTTWPCYHFDMHLCLSCSSPCSPFFPCFLLLYGAAPSSSNPQEVIHFLIICTSNRGRRRDADHKFSPPPPLPSPPLWCDSAATAASNWGCRFKLLTYDFPPIH